MKTTTEIVEQIKKKILKLIKEESSAEQESWWILEAVTGKSKATLLQEEAIKLSPNKIKKLDKILQERIDEKKPLQYIIGTVPFCGLEIFVEPPILIPRPETEEWCSWLIEHLQPFKEEPLKILDIGAGSGCIALALANALPYATVIGIDINPTAIRLCEKNKSHLNIKNALFIKSDLYQELSQHKKTFDIIVSNPPYIAEKDFSSLSKEVTQWEDKKALVANEDGFAMHRKILQDAHMYLAPNYKLVLLECGKGQDQQLVKFFKENNFETIETHKDLELVNRWVTGR